jgi:hypothetical protein
MDFHSVLADLWSWLLSNAMAIAWWGSLVCMVFAARVAAAFLKDNPRIFSVMALLACAWALVLGYYGARLRGELNGDLQRLVTDVASVLLVYTGGLLILDTSAKRGESRHVVPIQILALYLLLFIAAPSVIDIVGSPNGMLIGISANIAKDIVSATLVAIAFTTMGLGAYRISSGICLAFFLFGLAIYGVLLGYANTRCLWNVCSEDPQITPHLALAFSVLKIVVNLQFCWIVGVYGMTQPVRDAGPIYWVLHFFRLAGAPDRWRREQTAESPAVPTTSSWCRLPRG